jgi:hypothetical protein
MWRADREASVEGHGNDAAPEAFVRAVAAAFQLHVQPLLMARGASDPADVTAALAALRRRLEALDVLLADVGTSANRASPEPVDDAAADAPDLGPGSDLDEMGRNQRSRVREMLLLEALSHEARPFLLGQLLRALEEQGFADGNGAIVSQLHRMKKVGLIDQPVNGMYEITQDGLGHLRKLRSSVGALLVDHKREAR